jgi:hypothetical protein
MRVYPNCRRRADCAIGYQRNFLKRCFQYTQISLWRLPRRYRAALQPTRSPSWPPPPERSRACSIVPPASRQRLRSDSFLILEFGKGNSECCPTVALQLYNPV